MDGLQSYYAFKPPVPKMNAHLKHDKKWQQQRAARRTAWILAAVAAAMFALSLWQGLR